MTSSTKPVASAILAVYNAESTIVACLKSLLSQSLPIEIIIVDDGSTDNTLSSMVRTYLRRQAIEPVAKDQVKILYQVHGGPALARNLGAASATSDILLFVDADMTFDPDYVKNLIAPIISKEVIGTYTTDERVANWENSYARCWNIQEGWEKGMRFPPNLPAQAGPAKYGTDFRGILKSEFDRVGGFDNIGYTDTWSLFNKLGVRPLATRAICYHKNPDTLSAVFRQARWSSKRPYKFGAIGIVVALLRTTLPVSLIVGLGKSLLNLEPSFFIFKIVYDFGRFVGIAEMQLSGKLSK